MAYIRAFLTQNMCNWSIQTRKLKKIA